MATIKEYDSFKTQDGRCSYRLKEPKVKPLILNLISSRSFLFIGISDNFNRCFLGQHEIDVEENHPYLFSMLGVTERNGKYNNVKFYNQYRPLF